MAQFFTDFSEYTTGVAPSDWSEQWTGGGGTVVDTGIPAGGGAKALEATTLRMSWDTPGTPSGDIEVVAKLAHSAPANNTMRVFLHGADASGVNYYYTNSTTSARRNLAKFVANVATEFSFNTGYSQSANTWYIARLQRTGTTIRWKFWADGAGEPGTWGNSTTDSDLSSGFVGLVNLAGTQWCDWFGVGTGGDTAPMEPVAGGILLPMMMYHGG